MRIVPAPPAVASTRRPSRWRFVVLAGCLAALGCHPAPTTSPPVTTTAQASPMPVATRDVAGQVVLPEQLVGASHVIPTGIGRVIPTGQGRYRVAEAAEDLPVVGAEVALYDATTHAPIPGLASVRTDDRGRFDVAGVTGDRNVLVHVTAVVGDQTFELLSLAHPGDATPTTVSWRSTAVVRKLLDQPGVDAGTVSVSTLQEQEASLASATEALPPAQQTKAIVGAVTTLLSSPLPLLPTASPSTAPLPLASLLPSALPLPLPSASASLPLQPVVGAVAQTASTTAGAVEQAVNTTVGAAQQTVDTTATAVDQTVAQATNVVGSLLNVQSPSPKPSPTPTPKPSPTPSSLLGGLGGLLP